MTELASVTETAGQIGFFEAAQVSDVPPGWVLKVTVGGKEIALANRDGEFYAVDSSCTHANGPLGDTRMKTDCIVECPWHGSAFDIRTGEVLQGPARKAIKTYSVKVEEGVVYVSI